MMDDHDDRDVTLPTAGSGVRRVIDAIERTPLALPMALVTAAAAAFVAFAVPATIVARGAAATGLPFIVQAMVFGAGARAVLMLVAALIAGVAVWWLFHRLEHPRQPAADPDIDLFAPDVMTDVAAAPQLRRADVHPDAPARRPLFAASDLGTPMDDVVVGQVPVSRPPLFIATAADRDEPGVLLLDESYWSAPTVPDREPTGPVLVPVGGMPTPEPHRSNETETIVELMARLERGLERRNGDQASGASAGADGHVWRALEEFRRMTTGR